MQAIALRKGADSVELVDVPMPTMGKKQIMVKMIRCGLCGTDREIIRRKIPDTPPGQDYLILGHESFGKVVDIGAEAETDLQVGDYATIMVRHGCGKCNACKTGHPDYCYTGDYKERGIHKIHGFFAEYVVDEPEYLVAVPKQIRELGVLAEPMSVAAKAYEVAGKLLGRVCFDGNCSCQGKREPVLVVGHGPIGMISALMLTIEGYDVSMLGRREKGDPQRNFIESFGGRYLDVSKDQDKEYAQQTGGFLVIMEAAGVSELAFRLPELLCRNGILILTGVPRGPGQICFDGNTFMANLVRFNQTVTGTVNASRGNFEMGLRYLGEMKKSFPEAAKGLITGRYPLEDYKTAFTSKNPDEIKAVIEFK